LLADSAAAILRMGVTPESLAPFRQPLIDRDVRRRLLGDSAYAPVHESVRQATCDTVVSVPMLYHDRHVGVVIAFYRPSYDPTERDIALLTAIASQATVAVENARLLVEAQGRAALEERQRLARELHDSVSQAIYGIGLGARTARALLDQDPSRAREPLDYVLALADAAMAEMRALIFELRPESLETEGLVAALSKQVAALQARHGVAVQATLGGEPDLPLGAKQTLYRIAQEALHNVVKHARASAVALRLETTEAGVAIEVQDDGVGFDPSHPFPGHLGLRSMRERVASAGGQLTISSTPGEGTRIRAVVPWPAAHDGAGRA
jgi:signal transduction histidine kinase